MARPPMPQRVKDKVWTERGGLCEHCGLALAHGEEAYNHNPSLDVRPRNYDYRPTDARHYIPNANDTKFIDLRHRPSTGKDCHDVQTFGQGYRLGDVQWAAKSKRIIRRAVESAQRVAAKEAGEPVPPRSKYRWAKRKITAWRNTKGEIVYAKDRLRRRES
jgi:hypothetical protein